MKNGELNAKCELAMMGKVVPVNSVEELEYMVKYICKVQETEYEELYEEFPQFKDCKCTHLVVNKVMDMKVISCVLESTINEYPAPFEDDFGTCYPCAFCYCFNLDMPYFSEYGDCFFEKRGDNYYHRIS